MTLKLGPIHHAVDAFAPKYPTIPWSPRSALVTEEISQEDLPLEVYTAEWTMWEEAEITDCLIYLRGSGKLDLPISWAPYVPTLNELEGIDS